MNPTPNIYHHLSTPRPVKPPPNHSVASIPDNVKDLYDAIIHYTAVAPNPQSTQPSARPFFINPANPFQPHQDDDDTLTSKEAKYLAMSRRGTTHIVPGSGSRRAQAKVPRLVMDLGNTAVTWPPPKSLIPPFLKAQVDTGNNPYGFPDVAGEEKDFYITHYELGEPKVDFYGNFKIMRWVRVSTPHGDDILHHFLHGVLQWTKDNANPVHGGDKYNLYRYKTDNCGGGQWVEEGSRFARSPESVVLAEGQMKDILSDVEQFLKPETKQWYLEHGLPARRSYLFEGLPGTGKTSTIRVLAGQFGLTCCFLAMTNDKFSNQLLADALSDIPRNALLVLEDVDALFNKDRSSQNSSSLTFSGLLNVLDGVTSVDGLVTVMTTNHAERLDPALIRGGRVDRRFKFAAPTSEQYAVLFKLFYKEAGEELVKTFVDRVMEHERVATPLTIATMQQLFIRYRGKSAQECLSGLENFLTECPAEGAVPQTGQATGTEQSNGVPSQS